MRILSTLLLLCFLSACLAPIDVGPGLAKISQEFSESMRWQDYPSAAAYLQQDIRDAFLKQFREDEDLHVVDSRILSVDLHKNEGWADAEYVLEYYRLPSTRIKKWRWEQHWRLIKEKLTKPGVWLIENAPPAFPWNQ